MNKDLKDINDILDILLKGVNYAPTLFLIDKGENKY